MQHRITGPGPATPAVPALAAILAVSVLVGCGDGARSPIEPGPDPLGPELAAAVGTDPVTGATIETNRDDYVPGEVVHVEGRGWAPHETVRLHLAEDPDTHEDVTQDVVADEHGAFSTHLYDVQAHDIGVLFTLTATGLTSGSVAVTTFTDGTISGASIQMRDGTCVVPAASVPVGTPICAVATFQITGVIDAETPVQFRWVNPSGVLAGVTTRSPNFPAGTSGTQTYEATFVPNRTGFWSVWLCESAGGGSLPFCSGSSERQIHTFEVTEATNSPPALEPIPEQSVDEGSQLTFTATATDPDSPAQTLTFSLVDAPAGATIDPVTGEFAWTPDDGPATVTFGVRVTDSGVPALFAEREVTVRVNNVAPAIGAFDQEAALLPVMTAIDITAEFDDPGTQDTHTCSTLAIADGIAPVSGSDGAGLEGSCTSSLLFEKPGVYTVVYTVSDSDGDEDSRERTIAVYDPSEGFVTGGGWIDSPAGAYAADPDLTGRAHFAFVSRYQKGSNVPKGSTEFRFREGGLEFHSTGHAWLVVNRDGGSAQFRGEGRLGGEDGYVFMVEATDGSPDRFRIRIWAVEDASNVVYDSGDLAIGGGSIVIHSPKK